MSAATPTEPTSTIVDIVTDTEAPARWETYPGAAPDGASGQMVCVWPGIPHRMAESVPSEDWGQVREQWHLNYFGNTIDEARKLRDTLLRLDWGRTWELEQISQINRQEVAEKLWQGSIIVRDTRVSVAP